MRREPFFTNSDKIIAMCMEKKTRGYVAAHSLTNAYYIMRALYSDKDRRDFLLSACKFLSIVDIDETKILTALTRYEFKNFEDCLQAECALACRADYIVTRNVEDFAGDKVKAITPEELIKLAESA